MVERTVHIREVCGPIPHMPTLFMEKSEVRKNNKGNLITWWLSWYFIETPWNIIKTSCNFIRFGFNYFSLSVLLRTFFSPWRQYLWKYPRGFGLKEYASVFFANLTSRILGALARSFLIIFAIAFEILTIISGLLIFCLWLISGPMIIILIILGLKWMI